VTEEPHETALVCADCGRSIPWHSDEAGEWPVVEDAGGFRTLCFDCYRVRYGQDESVEDARQTRAQQSDDRTEQDDR
jgi:hypothetical protein